MFLVDRVGPNNSPMDSPRGRRANKDVANKDTHNSENPYTLTAGIPTDIERCGRYLRYARTSAQAANSE